MGGVSCSCQSLADKKDKKNAVPAEELNKHIDKVGMIVVKLTSQGNVDMVIDLSTSSKLIQKNKKNQIIKNKKEFNSLYCHDKIGGELNNAMEIPIFSASR